MSTTLNKLDRLPEESTLIFQQKINCLTFEQLWQFILRQTKIRCKSLVCPVNLNILLSLRKNQKIKKNFEEKTEIIFADGFPLVIFSKLPFFSCKSIPERIGGTAITEKILSKSSMKIFLLGSKIEVLETIKTHFPSQIVGMLSPSSSQLQSTKYNQNVVKTINNSQAQVLLVALGPLKQEKWLLENYSKIDSVVCLSVGSALDILSGAFPRAPRFLQVIGLEWLWRLALEPRRLSKRYLSDGLLFIQLVFSYSAKKILKMVLNSGK
ncbi:MAG: WecB/TagA/CpsF family glycosyltransferase [Patescibacteria group bacterium]